MLAQNDKLTLLCMQQVAPTRADKRDRQGTWCKRSSVCQSNTLITLYQIEKTASWDWCHTLPVLYICTSSIQLCRHHSAHHFISLHRRVCTWSSLVLGSCYDFVFCASFSSALLSYSLFFVSPFPPPLHYFYLILDCLSVSKIQQFDSPSPIVSWTRICDDSTSTCPNTLRHFVKFNTIGVCCSTTSTFLLVFTYKARSSVTSVGVHAIWNLGELGPP